MVRFSVVIACYNSEQYIKDCLVSVIGQTYKNWEIVIIDDCSTDKSVEVIKSVIESHPSANINLIINKKNRGQSHARNVALKKSTGEYILFADADDSFYKDGAFDAINKKLKKKPVDMLFLGFMIDRINRKGKISCRFPFVPIPIISKMKAFQLTLGVSKFIWSICFRRTFLTDNNLTFDESIRFSEDVVYATSALIHAKKIESLPTICYCYNRRPDNPTSLSTKDETRKERVGKMILFSKAYKNIDAPKKYRKYLRLSGFLSFVVLSAYNVIVHIQNKFRKNG